MRKNYEGSGGSTSDCGAGGPQFKSRLGGNIFSRPRKKLRIFKPNGWLIYIYSRRPSGLAALSSQMVGFSTSTVGDQVAWVDLKGKEVKRMEDLFCKNNNNTLYHAIEIKMKTE